MTVTKVSNQDEPTEKKEMVDEKIEHEKDHEPGDVQGKSDQYRMSQEEMIDYANALIDQFYVEPSREELKVDIRDSIYVEIDEALKAIEDEEVAADLQMDVAMAISHLYFQEDLREALADEEVFEALTKKDLDDFALAFKAAELNTPSFAAYIKPEYEELLEKYEEE